MRLTLRTLLAYMDDILDPADQEELGRKIEASAFATELIHRSRDAVRRLRLSAPDPLAGDSDEVLHSENDNQLDANSAAEYLDNTLSPEDVAAFERTCLEAGPHADMLLAEAASCHHILTLVLGEPAEVDGDLRERMYVLIDREQASQQVRIEPAHATPNQQPVVVQAAIDAAPRMQRPQIDADEASVPDYMLEAARTRRRQRRMALGVFTTAAVLGGLAAWMIFASDKGEQLADRGDAQAPAAANEGNGSQADQSDTAGDSEQDVFDQGADDGAADAAATSPENSSTATPAGDPAGAPPAEEPAAQPTPTSPESGAPAAATAEVTVDGAPAEAPGVDVGATSPETAIAAALPAASTPEAGPPATPPQLPPSTLPQLPPQEPPSEVAPGSTVADAAAEPGATVAASSQPPAVGPLPSAGAAETAIPPQPLLADSGAAEPPADAASPVEAAAAPASPPQPRQVGAYLGNNDVLLRLDGSANSWIRLAPRSAMTPGDRLLVLPTFRTHVVLSDANAYLGGGTRVELTRPGAGAADGESDIRLALPYGRLILNSGLNGNRLELAIGDEVRTLALGPSSSLAIEVDRTFVPGANPERDPAPLHIDWFLTSGTALPAESLDGVNIEAPAAWTTDDGKDSAPQAIDELPKWIDSEPITEPERRARDAVAEALGNGEAVNIRLAELSDEKSLGRAREVRSLAARSGAYVGQFDALVKSLNDPNQHGSWKAHIDALRVAMARDPANVERIQEAFAAQQGQSASSDLMEMLIGFSAEDVGTTREEVRDGAMVRLLRWLENEDLTYRVLASHNINEITGTYYLGGFRPQHTAAQRQREIKYYADRFDRGELMPKKP